MDIKNADNKVLFSLTRRAFLKMSLWIAGIASGWGVFKFLSYKAPEENILSFITLSQPQTYPLGSATYIPEVKAWLFHSDDGFYALSSTCTHLGCTINLGDEKFNCPCHGSQFSLSGNVLQGPASAALPNFEVSLSDDGRLVIDRRVNVPSTQRLVI